LVDRSCTANEIKEMMMKMGLPSRDGKLKAPCQEEEEEEEEEGLLKADAVNEEDPERDRTTQV